MPYIKEQRTLEIEFDSGARGSFSGATLEEIEEIMGEPLPADPVFAQQEIARAEGATLFAGLGQLSPKDIVYAAKGRAMAYELGASQAEIDAIVDRQTAGAYITGTQFWTSMTTAEQQRWILDAESWVRILIPMVALLRDLS